MEYMDERIEQAEQGDMEAMFQVAWSIIWEDKTSEPDSELAEKAFRYYNQLADDIFSIRSLDAMLDLGAMYLEGRCVEKDEEKAFAWYKKAAQYRHPKAYRCLGNYWLYYSSEAPQPEKAYREYVKGSLLNEQNSLYELGDMYRNGIIEDKDLDMAFELYQKAESIIGGEERDDSYSNVMFRLGICYLDGLGVESDIGKALFYLQEAVLVYTLRIAEGDNPSDVNNLQLKEAQTKLSDALKQAQSGLSDASLQKESTSS